MNSSGAGRYDKSASPAAVERLYVIPFDLHCHQGACDSRCVEVVRATDYDALAAQCARLEAKLLELAGECGECMGSGTVMSKRGAIENVPCTDCEDIRELLP